MNASLVNEEIINLLSRITGQKLSQRDLTPPVIFLASLVTVLLGVIFADGTVAESEKQRLLTVLYRFSLPESDTRKLTHLMIKGVKENQLYKKSSDLITLVTPLTESQRLLLISLGYEMSNSDGDIEPREKKYLEIVAQRFGIKAEYLAVLEAAFMHPENVEHTAVDEVLFLLNPVQFQELDTIFVKAARDIVALLPAKTEFHNTQQSLTSVSYSDLKKFQENRQQLGNFCQQIFQIIKECREYGFLPDSFIEEITEVSKKSQSQRFRLAVVGEFSQGKSTLLNALLGEEIQPAREIPCSGTVTVLKYGEQKRVVCRYKDGREEEIPFTEYQQKASISEYAAIDCLSDELAKTDIEEIVFEHPDLELCRNGVEIVDSPGLNEHPERTAITQKLLKDTDAVIFLINASRPLTQGERDLLQEFKIQLNGGKKDEPASNLFIACNFMDLIRTEKDREQIKQRILNFVQGDSPIIKGENRVHFISARATLDAIYNGSEDKYLQDFINFSKSLENFLIYERGSLKLNYSIVEINSLMQKCLSSLHHAEDTLEGKIKLSESEKQKIFEQIGEASGRDVKIRRLADKMIEKILEEAKESWKEWYQCLGERMVDKSQYWHSEYSLIWRQDKLIKDYTSQFTKDLSTQIDEWGNTQFKDNILLENLKIFDAAIQYELEAIQADIQNLDLTINSNFSEQFHLFSKGASDNFIGFAGIGFYLTLGIFGINFIVSIITKIVDMMAHLLSFGMLDGLHDQIKIKIIETGLEKFDESIEKVKEKLHEIVDTVFDSRIESASKVISQAISFYENLIEQQEKVHLETLEQRDADKALILNKRRELEQLQNNIKATITI